MTNFNVQLAKTMQKETRSLILDAFGDEIEFSDETGDISYLKQVNNAIEQQLRDCKQNGC